MKMRLGCTLQQCDIWYKECDICLIYVCTLQRCDIWGRECSCRQWSSRRGLSTGGEHGGQGCPTAFNTRVNLIGSGLTDMLTDMIVKASNLWYQHGVSNILVSPDELYAPRYWWCEKIWCIIGTKLVFYRMMITWKTLWMGWWHEITIWWDGMMGSD